jgi:uncharacterized repeat protein (TIGR03843 family)
LRRLVLFDVVINNTDRKFGHILLDSEGRLFGCDHGVSFHEEWKLRTVLWQFAGMVLTEEEIDILRKTKDSIMSGKLVLHDLINNSEVAATLERIDFLLREQIFPQPDQDWPAVPWPPV